MLLESFDLQLYPFHYYKSLGIIINCIMFVQRLNKILFLHYNTI